MSNPESAFRRPAQLDSERALGADSPGRPLEHRRSVVDGQEARPADRQPTGEKERDLTDRGLLWERGFFVNFTIHIFHLRWR